MAVSTETLRAIVAGGKFSITMADIAAIAGEALAAREREAARGDLDREGSRRAQVYLGGLKKAGLGEPF